MKGSITELGKEKLQELYNNSSSYSDLLESLGLVKTGGSSRKTLKKYEKLWNIDKLRFNQNYLNNRAKHIERLIKLASLPKIPLSEVLVENSFYSLKNVKKRLLDEKLLEYKCQKCSNDGLWQGEKLALQLDHVNGINDDNRLENLRFLCPNCHTQTETWGNKSIANISKRKQIKQNEIDHQNMIEKRKRELKTIDLSKFGWVSEVSKMWNISHTQVKKWIKRNCPELKYYQRSSQL